MTTFAMTHARTTDPSTSHAAAASLGRQETIMRRLLWEFVHGEDGLTGEEAAIAAGLDRWQCSKRVSDLLAAGLLADTGECRLGSSGRQQRVLVATLDGCNEMEAGR